MPLAREVVITGIGLVTPIGIGKEPFWESLRDGRSGVDRYSAIENTEMPVKIAAQLKDFDPKLYVKPRKSLKVMCHEIREGFSAAAMAVEDAGLEKESVDRDRFGVIFGGEMFYGTVYDVLNVYCNCMVDGKFDFSRWGERAMTDIYPLWMLTYLPNMVSSHVGIFQDARGPNNTITLGEASSLMAMIECARVIERGDADVMITGGTGSRLNIPAMLYRGCSNLSHRNDEADRASRPFDAERDGMVNGEGAASFIMESGDHARARGAKILARVLGFGLRYESRFSGHPHTGDGLRNCMRAALDEAALTPRDVGHINANGVSTVEDDALEASAIRDVMGDVPVTALKSYFGNLGAGTGAVELAGSILAFERGEVPRTLNYEYPDEACPINVIHGDSMPVETPTAMSINQSGTGQTSALIIARS